MDEFHLEVNTTHSSNDSGNNIQPDPTHDIIEVNYCRGEVVLIIASSRHSILLVFSFPLARLSGPLVRDSQPLKDLFLLPMCPDAELLLLPKP